MITYTANTWWAIADRIGNLNMTFSTGFHERMADSLACYIVDQIENEPLHADVTIDFEDNWDAQLIVRQALRA